MAARAALYTCAEDVLNTFYEFTVCTLFVKFLLFHLLGSSSLCSTRPCLSEFLQLVLTPQPHIHLHTLNNQRTPPQDATLPCLEGKDIEHWPKGSARGKTS